MLTCLFVCVSPDDSSQGDDSTGRRKEDFVLFRRSDCVDDLDTSEDEDDLSRVSKTKTCAVPDEGSRSLTSDLQQRGLVGTVTNMLGSAVRHIAGDELTNELFSPITALQSVDSLFEDAIGQQFL